MLKYKTRICANCHKEFTRLRYIKCTTCSVSCGLQLRHKRNDRRGGIFGGGKVQKEKVLTEWQDRLLRESHLETLIREDGPSEVL